MQESGTFLIELLLVLLGLVGLVVGAVLLHRQNKAKTMRTQALFGVSGAPGPQPGGRPAVVVAKRTYTWPDRIGYYITFQSEGVPPLELEVTLEWYGYLNPGDRGALTVQEGQFGGFYRAG